MREFVPIHCIIRNWSKIQSHCWCLSKN